MATHSRMLQTRRRRKVDLKRTARIEKKARKDSRGAKAKPAQAKSSQTSS